MDHANASFAQKSKPWIACVAVGVILSGGFTLYKNSHPNAVRSDSEMARLHYTDRNTFATSEAVKQIINGATNHRLAKISEAQFSTLQTAIASKNNKTQGKALIAMGMLTDPDQQQRALAMAHPVFSDKALSPLVSLMLDHYYFGGTQQMKDQVLALARDPDPKVAFSVRKILETVARVANR